MKIVSTGVLPKMAKYHFIRILPSPSPSLPTKSSLAFPPAASDGKHVMCCPGTNELKSWVSGTKRTFCRRKAGQASGDFPRIGKHSLSGGQIVAQPVPILPIERLLSGEEHIRALLYRTPSIALSVEGVGKTWPQVERHRWAARCF